MRLRGDGRPRMTYRLTEPRSEDALVSYSTIGQSSGDTLSLTGVCMGRSLLITLILHNRAVERGHGSVHGS